jgi:predicted dehydrogenase
MGMGVIGAGLFARGTLVPHLKRVTDVRFRGVATQTGMTGAHVARRYGFAFATSTVEDVINDPEARAVVIATRHDSHAALAAQALRAGKDVFVEKPLAMTAEELRDVVEAWNKSRAVLMVGFNRRHSPHAIRAREFLEGAAGPSLLHIRVNAGDVPPGHWVNDPRSGGDRVRGEVCHFVDLVQFLTGAEVVSVDAAGAAPRRDGDPVEDCALILRLADGSIGNILYTARGTRRLGRERVEIFRGGRVAVIDDFHTTRLLGHTRRRAAYRTWGVDRGHRGEIDAWLSALRGREEARVPFVAYVGATAATLAAADALQSGRTCRVETDWGVRP